MFGEGSIQLGRIAGIRIGASPSWFLILFVAIWLLSGQFEDILGSQQQAYVVAVAGAALFFGSIILHELGHAFEARRSGVRVEGIDLWLFGGVAKLDRDSRTPGEEFRVAAAGPAVTLLIMLVGFGATVLFTGSADAAWDVTLLRTGVTVSVVELLVSFVVTMNAFLLAFNLLPAFPLDGGRITRAAIWKLTGSRLKGTVAAAWLGQAFGVLLIGLGAYTFLANDDAGNGIWWAVLGWLIATSARSAAVSARVTDRLEGVTVGDIMDEHPLTLPSSMRLIDAEEWFEEHHAEWAAVTDGEGRLLGIAERARVETAIGSGQPALEAGEVLSPGDPVTTDQSLEAVIHAEPLRRLGAVMAVDANGVLRGVLTIEQVRRALTTAVP